MNNASHTTLPTIATSAERVKRTPPIDTATIIELARLLADTKFENVMAIDVRGVSQVQDYILIASGTSDRQMRSSVGHIKEFLRARGHDVYRASYDDQSTWIVIDCVDAVVHLFEPNTRSYYDIESMWGDGKPVAWERPGDRKPVEEPFEPETEVETLDLTTPSPAKPVTPRTAPTAKKRAAKKAKRKPAPKATTKPRVKKAAAKAAKKTAKKPAKKAAKKPVKKAAKKAAKKK